MLGYADVADADDAAAAGAAGYADAAALLPLLLNVAVAVRLTNCLAAPVEFGG